MKILKIFNILLVLMLACGGMVFAQTDSEPNVFEFYNDLALDIPFQDAYIETGDGMVKRVEPGDPLSTLFQPLYTIQFNNPPDMEAPFEVGPYEMGEPLGVTLADWLLARGTGTYTASGDRATLDLEFENLIANGVYTMWCMVVDTSAGTTLEIPCGAADGSESIFTADEAGNGQYIMEIDAFNLEDENLLHVLGVAYHSDGQTYGASPGNFGQNVHVQIVADVLPNM